MKYIVFTTNVYGHFMEYIHHLCMAITEDDGNELFVVVPSTFLEKKEILLWPENDSIHFEYYEEEIVKKKGHNLRNSYNAAKILGSASRRIKPDRILLLSMMQVMPFVVFFVPKGIKISGIIYNIYLYKWKKESFLSKLQDVIKYSLFKLIRNFERVFILNDSASAKILNRIWKTKKFIYLPDPCFTLNNANIKNIKTDIGISPDKKVFLHFGSLTRRKGTLMLFDIISRLPDHILKRSSFIFAGRIWDDLKTDFYNQYSLLKDKANIIVFDKFCSYEFFGSLCKSSDYIVLPYQNTSNSSGIISYGAQLGVPVIVPANGMVPKLVKKYKIGMVVKGDFTEEMTKRFHLFMESEMNCSDLYAKSHTICDFTSAILS